MNNTKITNSYSNADLRDGKRDEQRLQPDFAILDLPEVKDIPGQENIHPPKLNMFADTTISSDDEEGKGLLDFDDDDDLDEDDDISDEELDLLEKSENNMDYEEDEATKKALVDNTDTEGDLLNEQNDLNGDDLDVPGAEDDDDNEALGEEDEENNYYGLGGDGKD